MVSFSQLVEVKAADTAFPNNDNNFIGSRLHTRIDKIKCYQTFDNISPSYQTFDSLAKNKNEMKPIV